MPNNQDQFFLFGLACTEWNDLIIWQKNSSTNATFMKLGQLAKLTC